MVTSWFTSRVIFIFQFISSLTIQDLNSTYDWAMAIATYHHSTVYLLVKLGRKAGDGAQLMEWVLRVAGMRAGVAGMHQHAEFSTMLGMQLS